LTLMRRFLALPHSMICKYCTCNVGSYCFRAVEVYKLVNDSV